jgi:hypothetical protein
MANGRWIPSPLKPATTTDDRGHYRISGLPKGKYAVKADLPTDQSTTGLGSGSFDMHPNYGDALVVYSGGVFREKDIKPIEVGAGDDVDGVDLVFPVDNLHLVSGTVTAKTDSHPLNAGWVNLTTPRPRPCCATRRSRRTAASVQLRSRRPVPIGDIARRRRGQGRPPGGLCANGGTPRS